MAKNYTKKENFDQIATYLWPTSSSIHFELRLFSYCSFKPCSRVVSSLIYPIRLVLSAVQSRTFFLLVWILSWYYQSFVGKVMVANLSWCQLVFKEISVCWKLPNHAVSLHTTMLAYCFLFPLMGRAFVFVLLSGTVKLIFSIILFCVARTFCVIRAKGSPAVIIRFLRVFPIVSFLVFSSFFTPCKIADRQLNKEHFAIHELKMRDFKRLSSAVTSLLLCVGQWCTCVTLLRFLENLRSSKLVITLEAVKLTLCIMAEEFHITCWILLVDGSISPSALRIVCTLPNLTEVNKVSTCCLFSTF